MNNTNWNPYAGYRAFNGYIWTQRDCDTYNKTYFANEDEQHRFFVNICMA